MTGSRLVYMAGPSGKIWIVFYTELKALNCSPLLTPISSFWPKGLHLVDVSLLTVTFLLLSSGEINIAEKKLWLNHFKHTLCPSCDIFGKSQTINKKVVAKFRIACSQATSSSWRWSKRQSSLPWIQTRQAGNKFRYWIQQCQSIYKK